MRGLALFEYLSSAIWTVPRRWLQIKMSSCLKVRPDTGNVPGTDILGECSATKWNIRQQFKIPDIKHEPAYSKYPLTQAVTYYAVAKLAAVAERP